jgi:2,4-dienoyl-CoA reductase-like NADH-dependent reductase (Old Yellow Enzyme family)
MTITLASPLTLPCGALLPNRIAKAPMTEGLADARGDATPALARLYALWSGGGAGLLVTGNVMVDRRFLERSGNVVLDAATDEAALRAWTTAGTRGGNHLWAQLNHPGRQCNRFQSDEPVAPSAIPLGVRGLFRRPRALESAEIEGIVEAFARAAVIAQRTGFTGVQVHAAHGYLIGQFLSPRTNRRTDAWGGSLPARARFVLEVVRAVRSAVGEHYPVSVKLNSSDFQRGGFTHAEAVEVARMLAGEGIDLLEVSGGTYERVAFAGHDAPAAPTRAREAYFLAYARDIAAAVPGVPLMVSGGFRTPAFMEEVLGSGEADVLGIGRPFCVEPTLAARLLSGGGEPLPSPERGMRLGPGILGAASTSTTVRALNAQAATGWYYEQMYRLADGRAPQRQPGSGLGVVARHLWREVTGGAARRRAAL